MAETRGGEKSDLHFLYVADPMCSWCYGFAPVIAELRERFEGRLPIRLIVGGLRAGNTAPMRQKDKDYIQDAWARVSAATGQPFDEGFFSRENFVYDTEPACRAVVAVRRMRPELALGFMSRISSAFYGDNRDMTAPDELAAVAEEAGLDGVAFRREFEAADTRNDTFRDFLTAKQLGIEGFPTLCAGNDTEGYALITQGYRPIDGIPEAIERWLSAGAPLTKPASDARH
jgi:putative protein-disulfide isomerase